MIFIRCTDPKFVTTKDITFHFGPDSWLDYIAGEPIPLARSGEDIVIGEGFESVVISEDSKRSALLSAILPVKSIDHDEDSNFVITLMESAVTDKMGLLPEVDISTKRTIHTPIGIEINDPQPDNTLEEEE